MQQVHHRHTTGSQQVFTFTLQVHYRYTTGAQRYTAGMQQVHHRHTTGSLQVSTFTPQVHYMCTTCTLQVHHRYTTCTLLIHSHTPYLKNKWRGPCRSLLTGDRRTPSRLPRSNEATGRVTKGQAAQPAYAGLANEVVPIYKLQVNYM